MSTATDPWALTLDQLCQLRADARRLRLPGRTNRALTAEGRHRSPFRGRGMQFAEHRPYHPGDDIRHIDWRVTARQNEPYTKCFEPERERPLLLLTHLTPSQCFGSNFPIKSVAIAQAAATLAWAGLKNDDRIGGIIAGVNHLSSHRPERRRQTVLRFLERLVREHNTLQPSTATPRTDTLNEALAELRRITRPGSRVVVISDLMVTDEETESSLRALATHNEVVALRVLDPLEDQAPPPGHYGLAASDGTLWVNARTPQFRDELESRFREHEQQLQQRLNRAGARYFRHVTDRPLTATLAAMLS